ncbi:MAG: response regulator [Leptolyngbyaceae cyanobacterium bins.349]|nr:response regulator [Leptolyngbyaceae cyanobacterium bins.349]
MKLLLVEDDSWLSATLVKVLQAQRYQVDTATDGQSGLALATTLAYDLLLLDVQLPQINGMELCRRLRSQGYRKPILLLTAQDSDAAAIAGFEAGADDYITKPCAPEVLLARVRTWLRRSGAMSSTLATSPSTAMLTWGPLSLDPDAGRVTIGGKAIALTATEYKLLELFLRHPDRIFSRSAILDQLWGFDDAPTDRAIVTHVKDVRKKLKAGGLTEEIIETVYGMGYRLKPATAISGQSSGATTPNRSESASAPPRPATIDTVLKGFQKAVQEQVAVLAQARAALLTGPLAPELAQAAQQEAHKLAGSLAAFGYPDGSRLARSIEHWLMQHGSQRHHAPSSPSSSAITHFAALVNALQQLMTKEPVAPAVAAIPSRQVLVIDADPGLTDRLQAEAPLRGLDLHRAPDLAAARSRLTPQPPDIVLLDLSFPALEEDGLTLLREMTEQLPQLPVIVLTGRDSLADRLAVSRLGARQFLHKPASPEQIFQAIAREFARPTRPQAKVLIVDDDPVMLATLSAMLTPWGVEVAVLAEPQHFWQMLQTVSPHLILLDLEMPEINGLELCQVVRQDAHWGDLPILVVTAHTTADSLQQAFAAGADDFITKPVLGPELVTRVLSRIQRAHFH